MLAIPASNEWKIKANNSAAEELIVLRTYQQTTCSDCVICYFQVGYEIGASGQKLPDVYMNELDNELIPVIHSAAANSQEGPVTLELILFIID